MTWMDHRPQLCLRNLFFSRNYTEQNRAATADEYQKMPSMLSLFSASLYPVLYVALIWQIGDKLDFCTGQKIWPETIPLIPGPSQREKSYILPFVIVHMKSFETFQTHLRKPSSCLSQVAGMFRKLASSHPVDRRGDPPAIKQWRTIAASLEMSCKSGF